MTDTNAPHANSLNPRPSQWTCDACGQPINLPGNGWVEWLTRDDPTGRQPHLSRGLRLVHHLPASPRAQGCYHDEEAEYARDQSTISDMPLSIYLGTDGLMELLIFLDEQTFDDPGEILELIKRLHVPLYEPARPHLKNYFGENGDPAETKFPLREEMLAAIKWARGR